MQSKLFEFRSVPMNGMRVRRARELQGLTQAALAEALGIDQTMVAHIERGSKQPTGELLEALSVELHVPTSFFRQADPPLFPRGTLLFRAKSGIGKKVVAQAHAHAELAFELVMKLSTRASLIPMRLPVGVDAIEAAGAVRLAMSAPAGPLIGLLRAVERLGVLVIPLPDLKDCDAFSVWAGSGRSHPVIGLVVRKAADRIRMNIAHELGHLVLHRDMASGTLALEMDAYRFAAELLMPARGILDDLGSEKLTLFRLASLKTKWRVSMQALVRRARDLQVISDRQYRYSMKQIGAKGWRTEEPDFGRQEIEKPRAIRKLAEVACGPKPNWKGLAAEYALAEGFVGQVMNACASAPEKSSPLHASENRKAIIPFRRKKEPGKTGP